MRVYAIVLMLSVATSLVASAAAKCDRTGLDKETRGGTWDVYLMKEFDWVDYTEIAGCLIVNALPGPGTVLSAVCATELTAQVVRAVAVTLSKYVIAPPTDTQLIEGLAAGGAELITPNGRVVRLGLVGFTCKACNCRSCWKNNAPRIADCKRCGEFCTPEPNRVGIFLAVRKEPNGGSSNPSVPGGGSTSGTSRCITINNACPTEYWASVGLANTWNDGSADFTRWWSQGWYKVPANTGTSPTRVCFNGIMQFYLHFQNNAVTFSAAETSTWCIHGFDKYSIMEMDSKATKFYNYYDSEAGVGGSTCTAMGSDYKDVTFYRFVYSSSSKTNYNININCGSRVASRAAAAGDKALPASATARATGGVAVLPNPATVDIVSAAGTDTTTTASAIKEAQEPALAAADPVAVPAPKVMAADAGSEAEPEAGSSDMSGQAAKGASP